MLATRSDAVREWTGTVGAYPRFRASQWLLSDYDTWELNPHYRGPEQGHPEDEYRTSEQVAAYDHACRIEADDRDPEFWDGACIFKVRRR